MLFCKVAVPADRKGDEADGGFLGSVVERFPLFPHLHHAVSVCRVSWEGKGCPDQQCSQQITLSPWLLAWL